MAKQPHRNSETKRPTLQQSDTLQKAGCAVAETHDDLADLRPSIQALFEVQGQRAKLFRTLFVSLCSLFTPVVCRRDLRQGAMTRCEMRKNAAIDQETATALMQRFLNQPLTEIQCDIGSRVSVSEVAEANKQFTVICLSFPDFHSGENEGGIALLLAGRKDEHQATVRQIEKLTTLAITLSELTPVANSIDVAESLVPFQKASEFKSLREFSYSFVNSLSNRFHCDQVGFGALNNQRIEVLAISGLASFKPNSPGVSSMRQAMEECADACKMITRQRIQNQQMSVDSSQNTSTNDVLHRQWSHETGNACVLSTPFQTTDGVSGVVSLRRPETRPFSSAEQAAIETQCAQFAAPAALVAQANMPLRKQIKQRTRTAIGHFVRPKSFGRFALQLSLLALVAWFFFGTMRFRPICQTEVVPANTRHFSAPFAGRLQDVFVQAGSEVKSGELLAVFDTRDLALELNTLVSEVSAKQIELRQSLDSNDVDLAALYQAEIVVLQTRGAALQKQIEGARLIAPSDGTIVRCDAREKIGQVFAQGDALLQFASHDGWVLQVRVPDSIATYAASGQIGTFAAAARPDEPLEFELIQLAGTSQVIENENVFVAEASLAENSKWLRAGMQGTAQIETIDRPVWWVTLRSIVDWMQMRFWL